MTSSSAEAVMRLAGRAPALALSAPPVTAPARSCGRVVHFVDIENLCGRSHVRLFDAKRTMREYHAVARIADATT